jgi:diacylglycerol kinase (ATP)
MKQGWSRFVKSFENAGRGIRLVFKGRNMKVDGLVAIAAVVMGMVFKLSTGEWVVVLILIGLVLGAELINTSIEELANIVRNFDKLNYQTTKSLRDLAAGGVLVIAIMAAVVGMIIFLPKIF